jgi:hypothetical protein
VRLYVETMDATLVEVSPEGQVRYEAEPEWSTPTVQERRAIIHAARQHAAELAELLDILDDGLIEKR